MTIEQLIVKINEKLNTLNSLYDEWERFKVDSNYTILYKYIDHMYTEYMLGGDINNLEELKRVLSDILNKGEAEYIIELEFGRRNYKDKDIENRVITEIRLLFNQVMKEESEQLPKHHIDYEYDYRPRKREIRCKLKMIFD